MNHFPAFYFTTTHSNKAFGDTFVLDKVEFEGAKCIGTWKHINNNKHIIVVVGYGTLVGSSFEDMLNKCKEKLT
jgi:hypothetical protein